MNPYIELALTTAKIILLAMESQTPAQRAQAWDRFFSTLDKWDANGAQVEAFFGHLIAEMRK